MIFDASDQGAAGQELNPSTEYQPFREFQGRGTGLAIPTSRGRSVVFILGVSMNDIPFTYWVSLGMALALLAIEVWVLWRMHRNGK